jgi:hypothetical protein
MLGLSQYEVSKLSGVERTRLVLFENNHITIRAEEREAIERALRDVLVRRTQEFKEELALGGV